MDYLLLTEIAAAYYLLLLYLLRDLAVLETFDAVLSFPCRCCPFARCLRHPYRRSRFRGRVWFRHAEPQHRKPQQLKHLGLACPRLLKSA